MTRAEAEILKKVHLLEKSQQNAVLVYVKSLLQKAENEQLVQFAGLFNSKEIKQINTAIIEGCENIDNHEW